ncbi:MAG: peptide-methionine (S)-S-oxide reductase, partial [Thermodesulfovibrionales bacterium]
AIFYHDEEQKLLALDTRSNEVKKSTKKIHTEVLPFTGFKAAEDYHQKYRLRNERSLFREFSAIYLDEKDLMNSTAVARVNGYLGGYGTPETLTRELNELGLSQQGKRTLVDILSSSRPAFKSCPIK